MGLSIRLLDKHCRVCDRSDEVFSDNITHNLRHMAQAAGIYMPLWHPEEMSATNARQILELCSSGYQKLLDDPDTFEKYNAPNGWGTYDNFVKFVGKYLEACQKYPDSLIDVSA